MAIIYTKQKSLYLQAIKYLLIGLLVAMIGRVLLEFNVMITILTLMAFPFIISLGEKFLVGAQGERRVTREIKKFDNNYHLFNDIKIPGNQIDHILVCPKGVFTIETKNYKRKIYGNENNKNWTQYVGGKPYSVINPVKQGKRHSTALAIILKDNGINISIKTIVVFAGPAEKKAYSKTIPVIYRKELYDYLNKQKDILSSKEILNYTEKIIKIVVLKEKYR